MRNSKQSKSFWRQQKRLQEENQDKNDSNIETRKKWINEPKIKPRLKARSKTIHWSPQLSRATKAIIQSIQTLQTQSPNHYTNHCKSRGLIYNPASNEFGDGTTKRLRMIGPLTTQHIDSNQMNQKPKRTSYRTENNAKGITMHANNAIGLIQHKHDWGDAWADLSREKQKPYMN